MAIAGKTARISLLALAAGFSLNAHADWTNVYSNDFNSGASAQISGAGSLAPVAGYGGIGNPGNQFSGQYWVNDTGHVWNSGAAAAPGSPTTLTLTGLADHTAISLSFLLAIRDSWDGSYYAPSPNMDFANPDYFNVAIDGQSVFSETFSHRLGTPAYVQSYQAPAGGLLTPTMQYLGGNQAYPDSAYDMGLDPTFQSIAHTGSTLTISFWADGRGWQGGMDESWGMDNLRVSILTTPTPPPAQPIPEPETYAMLLAGLGLMGVVARRRQAGH